MPSRRIITRIDISDPRKGMKEAEKLLQECASKSGSPYIEKVSSTAVEVGCIYEAPDETVVESVGGVKYEYKSIQIDMPENITTQAELAAAMENLKKFEKFVSDCRASGGEVSLSKSVKVVKGARVPSVVVMCVRRS
jgi:hypothetical protein